MFYRISKEIISFTSVFAITVNGTSAVAQSTATDAIGSVIANDDPQSAISCETNPLAALATEVSPSVLIALTRVYQEQERNELLLDERYSVLSCEPTRQTPTGFPNIGMRPISNDEGGFGLPDSSGVIEGGQMILFSGTHQSFVTGTLNESYESIFPDVTADLPRGFSEQRLNQNLVEMCKNPRQATLLTLPNTPQCQRAAEYMEALGLGSQALGVPEDTERVRRNQQEIIEAIERGRPDGTGVELGLGVIGVALAAYATWRYHSDRAAEHARNTDRLNGVNDRLDDLYAREAELNSELQTVQEIQARPDYTGGVGDSIEASDSISEESRDRAFEEGAQSPEDIEESIRDDRADVRQDINNQELEKERLEAELGCTGEDGCEATCIDESCIQNALDQVYRPAREAIAQCEAQANLVTPVGPESTPFETIIEARTPNCSVQFFDDPCFSLSPDGCDPLGTAEAQEEERRNALTIRLASSLHCRSDDVVCEQTANAMIGTTAGLPPSGPVHSMICGDFSSLGPINLTPINPDPGSSAFGDAGNDSTTVNTNPQCLSFMGARRCGREKDCHVAAQTEILSSSTAIMSEANLARFYGFLANNTQCSPYEQNLRVFWMSYSLFLSDLQVAQRTSVLDSGSAGNVLPFSLGVITNSPDFSPLAPNVRAESIPGAPDLIVDPGIGGEDYYRANFCE